jgi:nucleoside 2-deoxyribosyltransferase
MTLRLYLAGPDVFRPEPIAHGEALKALCAEFGFSGLYPLDNTIAPQADGPATAAEIYRQNIALIDLADAVIATMELAPEPEPAPAKERIDRDEAIQRKATARRAGSGRSPCPDRSRRRRR